jgi:hypothetical protein
MMERMSTQRRVCKHTEVAHLRNFLGYAKLLVNEKWYYPPSYGYQYMVALALYSKCITVAEAILVLLEAGFGDEAFAMTRTLVDVFFTLRYIANQDTHDRAKRYAQFAAKSSVIWSEVMETYWPGKAQPLPERTKKLAATFPNPHSWSGKTAKDMAYEPDSVEVDANGKPMVHDVAYRIVFRWTSRYVHPTVDALRNHLVQAGHDNFVVRSRNEQDMTHMAAFNVASYVTHTMIVFYRCMGDPQPDRLARWAGALVKHIGRRHD